MRLREILPELVSLTWQRWLELAPSVPPHDPMRLLAYIGHVEHEAKAGNEAAVAMLGLFDDMLRALIAAGIDGRIIAEGLNGTEILQLRPSHWVLLNGVAARELRRSIDPGNDRIRLPGETIWDHGKTVWDHGEVRWDVGIPETDIAVIEGVVVSYAAAEPVPASAELLQASAAPVSEAPLLVIADPKVVAGLASELLEKALPSGRQFDRLVLETWLASGLKYDCATGVILRVVDKRHKGDPLLQLSRTTRYDSVKRVRKKLPSRDPSA